MRVLPPDDEAGRLGALREHSILDTAPEEQFDDLVRLAAQVCGTPIAAVSLIDEHRQWFKAITGLDATETPRDVAFCDHTIRQNDLLVVPDATQDERFADNPLVTNGPRIRFYAGLPLATADGHALGSLCVIDTVPRTLTHEQIETLRLLARQASSHLKAARQIAEREQLLLEKQRLAAEKQHLAAIIEHSDDAIYGKTLDGIVTSWNGGAERLYGYTAQEMIGRHVETVVPPERWGEVREILAAIRQGRTVQSEETVHVTLAGVLVDVSLQVSPVRDGAGSIVSASVIARDITQQRLTQIANSRLAAIVESSEDAIYGKTLDGTITSWNTGAAAIYGYSATEMIGQRVDILVPPDRRDELAAIMTAVRRGERVAALETARVTKDGGRVEVSLRVSPVRDADGDVIGAFMIARDITERRRAEAALAGEQEFTRALLESLQEGIVACDAEGTLTLFNRASRELHGLPEQPLPPEQWADHFDLYEKDGLTPLRTRDIPLYRALLGEVVRDAEMVIAPRFGQAHTILASGRPILGVYGERLGAVAAMHDITERKQIERELARLAAIVESSQEAMMSSTLDGSIVSWNRAAERLYGYAASEVIGRNATFLAGPDQKNPVPAVTTRLIRGEAVAPSEVVRTRRDGTVFNALLTFSPIFDERGSVVGQSCVTRDITERKALEAELHERTERLRRSEAGLRAVLESAPVILYVTDQHGIVTLSEGTGLAALGLRPGETVGRSAFDFSGGDVQNEEYTRRAMAGEAVSFDARYGELCLHTELRPIRGADGSQCGVIGVCFDVTERRRAEEQIRDYAVVLEHKTQELEAANARLEDLATKDGLTGVHNHRSFQERLREEVERADRYGTPLSLIFADVDKFKEYNDTFGHPAGDAVLKTVAHVFKDCARDTDVVTRYGGEEFAVLLPQTDLTGALTLAERLRAALEARPWPLRAVTISVGVSSLGCGTEHGTDLIARADGAMYESKVAGRNRVTCAATQRTHCHE